MSQRIKDLITEFTGRYVAQVLWVSKRDGNGILKTVEGHEIYFDKSVCNIDFDSIRPNQYLEFEFNQNIADCLCACNITLDLPENHTPELITDNDKVLTDIGIGGQNLYYNNKGLFSDSLLTKLK